MALVVFMIGVFTGDTVTTANHGGLWLGGWVVFGFLYYWIGLAVTGRSIGKACIGLRVVGTGGEPISPGRAAVRTLVYPFSFILGLGLIPIVVGKQRRALHDFAGRDKVLYDWGDRPAELPAPLTQWVRRRIDAEQVVETSTVEAGDHQGAGDSDSSDSGTRAIPVPSDSGTGDPGSGPIPPPRAVAS